MFASLHPHCSVLHATTASNHEANTRFESPRHWPWMWWQRVRTDGITAKSIVVSWSQVIELALRQNKIKTSRCTAETNYFFRLLTVMEASTKTKHFQTVTFTRCECVFPFSSSFSPFVTLSNAITLNVYISFHYCEVEVFNSNFKKNSNSQPIHFISLSHSHRNAHRMRGGWVACVFNIYAFGFRHSSSQKLADYHALNRLRRSNSSKVLFETIFLLLVNHL